LKTIKHNLLLILILVCTHSAFSQSAADFDKDSLSNIIVPNVFTPNADSVNDIFKPITDEITELNFSIYNRYGNLIFETSKVNGFWDGRTTSGEPCTDGVYFCILNATGIDGKKYKEKTFVQLFTNGYYKK